jgi:hypothetical protein
VDLASQLLEKLGAEISQGKKAAGNSRIIKTKEIKKKNKK